jgi:hypothetical protein
VGIAVVKEDSRLTVVYLEAGVKHSPYNSFQHLLLMTKWGRYPRQFFEEVDCIHQLCAGCRYWKGVPQAYGRSIVLRSKAWHEDQEEHLHLLAWKIRK